MKNDARRCPVGRTKLLIITGATLFILHASSVRASAAPTQEDVLRSIGQNLDRQTGDPSKLLALLAAAGGLALLLVVLAHRRQRAVTSKALHHHGKLLREISRAISLKPAELRQLKQLADDQDLVSPLTLLLCPSLLERAADARGDRGIIAGVLHKLRSD